MREKEKLVKLKLVGVQAAWRNWISCICCRILWLKNKSERRHTETYNAKAVIFFCFLPFLKNWLDKLWYAVVCRGCYWRMIYLVMVNADFYTYYSISRSRSCSLIILQTTSSSCNFHLLCSTVSFFCGCTRPPSLYKSSLRIDFDFLRRPSKSRMAKKHRSQRTDKQTDASQSVPPLAAAAMYLHPRHTS